MPNIDLSNEKVPSRLKFNATKGIQVEDAVVRDGGDEGFGLIKGTAVISRSVALGHDFWIDRTMLQQVVTAINLSAERGIKSRFTHPGMSDDGLANRLGQFKSGYLDGDIARADLHIAEVAHKTPNGNLADYVLTMAETHPLDFGNSIAFIVDLQATFEHWKAHGGEDDRRAMMAYWNGYGDRGHYQSDDPLNTDNLLHVRLKELRAVDVVDDPAANPSGMFHRNTVPHEADRLISYALGFSKEKPELSHFDIEPDRVNGFVNRFLQRHELQIIKKEAAEMSVKPTESQTAAATENLSEATPPAGGEQTPAAPAGNDSGSSEGTKEGSSESSSTPAPELSARDQATAELGRFVKQFGAENGGKWFSEGKSFSECLELHNEQLGKDLKDAQQKLSSIQFGELTPVSSSDAGQKSGEAGKSSGKALSGLDLFASTLQIPGL